VPAAIVATVKPHIRPPHCQKNNWHSGVLSVDQRGKSHLQRGLGSRAVDQDVPICVSKLPPALHTWYEE
jgi:hypothetical protein